MLFNTLQVLFCLVLPACILVAWLVADLKWRLPLRMGLGIAFMLYLLFSIYIVVS